MPMVRENSRHFINLKVCGDMAETIMGFVVTMLLIINLIINIQMAIYWYREERKAKKERDEARKRYEEWQL